MHRIIILLLAITFLFTACSSKNGGDTAVLPTKTVQPTQEAVINTPAEYEYIFIGIKESISSLEEILPETYKGTTSMCDGLSTYAFKLESGMLFTVNLSDTDITGGTETGYARVMKTGENAYLLLWKISENTTVSISGSNVTRDDITEFINSFNIQ